MTYPCRADTSIAVNPVAGLAAWAGSPAMLLVRKVLVSAPRLAVQYLLICVPLIRVDHGVIWTCEIKPARLRNALYILLIQERGMVQDCSGHFLLACTAF